MKNPRELTLLECEALFRENRYVLITISNIVSMIEIAQSQLKQYVIQQECKKIIPQERRKRKYSY